MNGLHLSGISHAFGANRVLDDVSVAVAPGELVCLLGPSGCGKTTLLRLAAGLEGLQTGAISIDGATVGDAAAGIAVPPERRGVGLMFQDYALFPHLSVRENIAFGTDPRDPARQAWIDGALGRMGLAEIAGMYPHTLSGGQQQRVALMRALAPSPKVLLLDEPFSGLDVTRRAQVRAETLKLVKEAGVATLMVTHDPEEAMFMADRILVMDAGHVVQDGAPTALYDAPACAFVAEFFGPVNRFEGLVEDGAVATPLGRLATPGLPDGAAALVLIRPEGIRPAAAGIELEIETARPLGPSSYISLRLPGGGTLEARFAGGALPAAGTRIAIEVDQGRVYAFPA